MIYSTFLVCFDHPKCFYTTGFCIHPFTNTFTHWRQWLRSWCHLFIGSVHHSLSNTLMVQFWGNLGFGVLLDIYMLTAGSAIELGTIQSLEECITIGATAAYFHTWEINCAPLSETMSEGRPKKKKSCTKRWAVSDCEGNFGRATNSFIISTLVRIVVLPSNSGGPVTQQWFSIMVCLELEGVGLVRRSMWWLSMGVDRSGRHKVPAVAGKDDH